MSGRSAHLSVGVHGNSHHFFCSRAPLSTFCCKDVARSQKWIKMPGPQNEDGNMFPTWCKPSRILFWGGGSSHVLQDLMINPPNRWVARAPRARVAGEISRGWDGAGLGVSGAEINSMTSCALRRVAWGRFFLFLGRAGRVYIYQTVGFGLFRGSRL